MSSAEKLWNRNFLLLFMINITEGIAFALATPMVSKYALYLGATLSFAGVIAGVFSGAALLMRPFAGAACDRLDKKKLMLISFGGVTIANLLAALAPGPNALLAIRLLHGVLFGLGGTTSMALGTQFVPKDRVGEGVGFLGMSLTLGNAVGPAAGIIIADTLGIRTVFFITSAMMAVVFCMMLQVPDQPAPVDSGKKISLSSLIAPEIIPFAFFGVLIMMTSGCITGFLVLIGEERAISGIGLFFTINAFVMVVSRPLAGKLVDRIGIVKTITPAYLCAFITMMLCAYANHLWLFLLAAVFHSFGYGMAHPALQAASINRLGVEHSGVATGTYYIGADLGICLGPIVGAALATSAGYTNMLLIMALLQIVGLALFLFYARTQKH